MWHMAPVECKGHFDGLRYRGSENILIISWILDFQQYKSMCNKVAEPLVRLPSYYHISTGHRVEEVAWVAKENQ